MSRHIFTLTFSKLQSNRGTKNNRRRRSMHSTQSLSNFCSYVAVMDHDGDANHGHNQLLLSCLERGETISTWGNYDINQNEVESFSKLWLSSRFYIERIHQGNKPQISNDFGTILIFLTKSDVFAPFKVSPS